MAGQDSFGCSAARKKGPAVCTNRTVIGQKDLEARVLAALEHHLMDEDAVRVFCEAYATERNRLQAEATAGRAELARELREVCGNHKKLVDAIIAGVPAEQVKDRMIALDTRRKALEHQLGTAPAPDPLRFHPSMTRAYRERIGALIRALTEPEGMEEAKEALRGLIEKIVLVPMTEDGVTTLAIDLHGALANLLRLAAGMPGAAGAGRANSVYPAGADLQGTDNIEELVFVAGANSRRNLPEIKCAV